jgi:poly-gamma-glutamate synthesis protein (capsule biosynthesis protein)
MTISHLHRLFAAFILLTLVACVRPAPGVDLAAASPTWVPDTATPIPTTADLPSATPTFPLAIPSEVVTPQTTVYLPLTLRQTFSVWADPALPPVLLQALQPSVASFWVTTPVTTTARFEVGDQARIGEWIYALAAPFPSLSSAVTADDLQRRWHGAADSSLAAGSLLMDASTYQVFTTLWGSTNAITVLEPAALLDYAWSHQPSWVILPFEDLEPRWKVLAIDGRSPLQKDFTSRGYALTVPISLVGTPDAVAQTRACYPADAALVFPFTNRDPARLTVLAMTGTTALVRATATTMERFGVLYPGEDIRDRLRAADLTHVSNEAAFAVDCPEPNPSPEVMLFCSQDEYIALLEDIGTDIVELTGDHILDWGAPALSHTLDLYKARGWTYFGGGANPTEASQALLIEHNHNRLAFLGCNAKGLALASDTRPGAAACDLDWMAGEVARLRQAGYLPVVTFQHYEYYLYAAQPEQQEDFRRLAEAGAVIVSGSQAHQPQGLEFLGSTLIHYGLGNLFFDQYGVSAACRQGVIDFHVFYAGRYLGTELWPIQFIDYARPRPMTDDEANGLLQTLFEVSGW